MRTKDKGVGPVIYVAIQNTISMRIFHGLASSGQFESHWMVTPSVRYYSESQRRVLSVRSPALIYTTPRQPVGLEVLRPKVLYRLFLYMYLWTTSIFLKLSNT